LGGGFGILSGEGLVTSKKPKKRTRRTNQDDSLVGTLSFYMEKTKVRGMFGGGFACPGRAVKNCVNENKNEKVFQLVHQ